MRVAFIIPWYGCDIPGGAEAFCRSAALRLRNAGLDVEILTTCVRDFYADWSSNYYRPGEYKDDGMTVRRFHVRPRDTVLFDSLNSKLLATAACTLVRANGNHLSPLQPEEEIAFLREMVNSPALYDFLGEFGSSYDILFFLPYMFGTTYFGSQVCPSRSVLIPCLHNESYAYMRAFGQMFSKVNAIVCLSRAEERLVRQLYGSLPKTFVVGAGIDNHLSMSAERFRSTFHIDSPFIVYAGRKDEGKNVPMLIDYFHHYVAWSGARNHLKLVLVGSGSLPVPRGMETHIIDLGFVSKEGMLDALAAAQVTCQPSTNESFSLVLMESLLAGTPVLVHAQCPVTVELCQDGNCGLYFAGRDEFVACLDFFFDHPATAARMGQNGRRYVTQEYSWDKVLPRYLDLFTQLRA
ncbi:glycosyltransferase family 4 protein [Candidatus Methylomirabilis sp.]|uniref:glycosyltransferase family 4 protein n=1 Tax=Candidatus Methylomirabilis sp. TaxID=2032687 RepID=UPI0030765317